MSLLTLELVSLGVASALIPLPLIVCVLLLRGRAGRTAAMGWVAGQTLARLVQGVLIVLVLGRVSESAGGGDTPGPFVSAVLIVLAVLFYVLAARKALKAPDNDAPPPGWLEQLGSASPGRAFLLGAGLLAISVKLWVLTLGATGAIAEARLDIATSVLAYLGFMVLALSLQAALLLVAVVAPAMAERLAVRIGDLLERYSRHILIVVGLVFGTVFLLEGLAGFGLH